MAPVGRGDELRRDADAVAGLSDAAFENVRHTKGRGDLANVLMLALERERRGARDHLQARDLRQEVDDFLGQAVAEVLVLLVAAHVLERQDRDRWLSRSPDRCPTCLQRGLHLVHRLKPLAGTCLARHRRTIRSSAGGAASGGGSSRKTALTTCAAVLPAKGARAGEHLVEDCAEAEDVGARVERFALGLLRRHVRRRARDDALTRARDVLRPTVMTFARPKSSTFARPSVVTMMLAGFRSRWRMPF